MKKPDIKEIEEVGGGTVFNAHLFFIAREYTDAHDEIIIRRNTEVIEIVLSIDLVYTTVIPYIKIPKKDVYFDFASAGCMGYRFETPITFRPGDIIKSSIIITLVGYVASDMCAMIIKEEV